MKILQFDSKSIFGIDGSGNQIKKWYDRSHLIKLNSKYREASKEVDAYRLGTAMGLYCAKYSEITVLYRGAERKACVSESYMLPDEVEITAFEILEEFNIDIPQNMSAVQFIDLLVNAVVSYTGFDIEVVYTWVYDMLVFDYIIGNDDRHLTNFEVLVTTQKGNCRFAPYFDHGAGFFRTDASLSLVEYKRLFYKFKSKPFSTNPDKNIGDYARAKVSFLRMLNTVGGVEGIKTLGMNQGHLLTVLRQISRLSEKLNIVLS